jgi:hypothetical protein
MYFEKFREIPYQSLRGISRNFAKIFRKISQKACYQESKVKFLAKFLNFLQDNIADSIGGKFVKKHYSALLLLFLYGKVSMFEIDARRRILDIEFLTIIIFVLPPQTRSAQSHF